MKKVLRAYKKTVSIVNETAIWMYENLGSDRIGFLMESNEKESDNSKSELEEKIYNKIMASIEKFVNKLLNEIF